MMRITGHHMNYHKITKNICKRDTKIQHRDRKKTKTKNKDHRDRK